MGKIGKFRIIDLYRCLFCVACFHVICDVCAVPILIRSHLQTSGTPIRKGREERDCCPPVCVWEGVLFFLGGGLLMTVDFGR